MRIKFFQTLSFQVILIIALGLSVMTLVQFNYSEEIIEGSILHETKKQALAYLLGIEREIQALPDPYDSLRVSGVLYGAKTHDISQLGFSIINIYCYNRAGEIFAFMDEPDKLTKDLSAEYGEVIRKNAPYLGREIESNHVDENGNIIHSVDVIVPIHYKNEVLGGLEVEINLNRTFEMIREIDDLYEKRIVFMLSVALVGMVLFIFLIVNWRVLAPLRQLGEVTKKIAAGEFKARVEYGPKNEIGRLGRSINEMARSIEALFHELNQAYIAILNSLSKALEARDEYTANHSENVARYAVKLGRRVGISGDELKSLAQGAMIHDLGKIGIPDSILNKPGKLREEEYAKIQEHPLLTAAILRPLEKFRHFSDIARSHHERWDGLGYPDGLRGDEIPYLARIVAIADSWDAITGDRVYRKGAGFKKALSLFEKERDSGQWDPELVDEFVRMMQEEKEGGA
ncbi:MAG: HD domain-containing protein [Proteobacteria bacterium]|nr:HD domain-containing protein [Pseudomonadota bacterium]MBU1739584.1 HD domain-containing protein [Pseudomonadota bacterium]